MNIKLEELQKRIDILNEINKKTNDRLEGDLSDQYAYDLALTMDTLNDLELIDNFIEKVKK